MAQSKGAASKPTETKSAKKPAKTSATEAKVNGAKASAPAPKAGDQAAQPANQPAPQPTAPPAVPTVAHTLGEMVWLMTRSPLHKQLKVGDLEWLLMPAILMQQFRLFRAGDQVVGMALWAYLTPAEAEELGKQGRLSPDKWRHGTDVMQFIKDQQAGDAAPLKEPALKDGEVELWLVDFVVPFATEQNKLAQVCMADLMQGPLKGKKLRMHKTDPKTREKSVIELGA